MKTISYPTPGRYLLWLLAGLLTVLSSCEDHGLPTAPQHGLRLFQIRVTAGRSFLNSDLIYDSQKRLTRLEEYQPYTNNRQPTTHYFYDGDNRLVRLEKESPQEQRAISRTLLRYNQAGQLTHVDFYDLQIGTQTAVLYSTNDYTYNGSGQLTGLTKHIVSSNVRNEYWYTYAGNNINQETLSVYTAGKTEPDRTEQTQFTFDDKLNPYRGLPGFNFDRPYLFVNQNNIQNPNITRSYNAQGLTTREFIAGDVLSGIIDFEYEPY